MHIRLVKAKISKKMWVLLQVITVVQQTIKNWATSWTRNKLTKIKLNLKYLIIEILCQGLWVMTIEQNLYSLNSSKIHFKFKRMQWHHLKFHKSKNTNISTNTIIRVLIRIYHHNLLQLQMLIDKVIKLCRMWALMWLKLISLSHFLMFKAQVKKIQIKIMILKLKISNFQRAK